MYFQFFCFYCSSILNGHFGPFTLWHRHLVEPFLKLAQVCILLPLGGKLSASHRKFRYIIANINRPFNSKTEKLWTPLVKKLSCCPIFTVDLCRQSALVTCNQVLFSCCKCDRNATTPYYKWAKSAFCESLTGAGFVLWFHHHSFSIQYRTRLR